MAELEYRSQRTESNLAAICCSAISCLRLLRKWFNVSSIDSDYSADTDDDKSIAQDVPKLRRRNSEIFRMNYMDTKSIRICAGTWNVGGRVPPADLDIDGWLDSAEPADIYVLGLQEIVPLNAGNIFGIEDDQPASEWEDIIRDALNRIRPKRVKTLSHSDPSSPSKYKSSEEVSYSVEDTQLRFDQTSRDARDVVGQKPDSGESSERPIVREDSLTNIDVLGLTNDNASCLPIQEYLNRQFSSSPSTPGHSLSMRIDSESQREERISCTERVGLGWPETPLSLLNQCALERRGSFKSVNLALMSLRKPSYVRIVSKQMVGVFLTVWVRRSLRKHISNLSVSTVGVGIMGYIGNKGSVSVSMSIYQTPFCFLCSHLSSGEKDTDHQRRNEDVREIYRRTQFHLNTLNANGIPRSIRDHERIIWLGDLNYRIDSSYEETHELIARKEWRSLLENDQLSREMTKGNIFEGWSEGTLDFPPTYKYEIDSDNYIGDESESGKRKPAWCDRIIWNGKGMKLFSYRRNENKLSDHRPVAATFLADVEVLSPRKLQRALALTYSEI